MLREQWLHLHKAGLYASCEFRQAEANGTYSRTSRWCVTRLRSNGCGVISHRVGRVTLVTLLLTARSIQKILFLMNIFFHHRPCIRKKRHMRHQRHRKTDTLAGTRRPVTYRAALSLLYPKPSRVSRSLRPLWLIVCLMPFLCAQLR